MPALPRLLGNDELARLLQSELQARRDQIEQLHCQLMEPFSRPAECSLHREIDKLQLLIQLADRHIELSHGLLEQHRQAF